MATPALKVHSFIENNTRWPYVHVPTLHTSFGNPGFGEETCQAEPTTDNIAAVWDW